MVQDHVVLDHKSRPKSPKKAPGKAGNFSKRLELSAHKLAIPRHYLSLQNLIYLSFQKRFFTTLMERIDTHTTAYMYLKSGNVWLNMRLVSTTEINVFEFVATITTFLYVSVIDKRLLHLESTLLKYSFEVAVDQTCNWTIHIRIKGIS